MLSQQKLQKSLEEIREIAKMKALLYTAKGRLAAATMEAGEEMEQLVLEFMESPAEQQNVFGHLFFRVCIQEETEYILIVEEKEENAFVLGQMAVCQIRNLLLGQAEQFDRNTFMQNVILGNMLKVDIARRAKKLHIEQADRVVFVIDTGSKQNDLVMELVKNLTDMKSRDFVLSVDERSVVMIKDVSGIEESQLEEELKNIANRLVDNLHMEAMVKVRIGYGNVASRLTDIPQSYQEANLALEVGKVFYAEWDTISYSRLGIGRLIYQLPPSLCQMFIREVFGEEIPDILEDEEAMSTIQKFFDNNLNISETSRQLYVHRNTLVYRLERIEKAIGLDIRSFEDAMIFKIALMVIAHMRQQQS